MFFPSWSSSRLSNKKGFTLIEVLIAVSLTSFAIVIMSSIMVESSNLSKSLESRVTDESERLKAEKELRSVFLHAVDLKWLNNTDINTWKGSNFYQGVLRSFDSDAEFGVAPATRTLAVFWRDTTQSPRAAGGTSNLLSRFQKTAVYFQLPTATTWGVLYIDLGQTSEMSPDRSDLIFEGLVGVKIQNVQTFNLASSLPTVARPVSSFDIEMTYRKYLNPVGLQGYVFCPRALLDSSPDCTQKTPSRDIKRTIRIVVRNNILTISPTANLPINFQNGRYGARPFDRIHFFKPSVSGDLL